MEARSTVILPPRRSVISIEVIEIERVHNNTVH